MTKSEEIIVSKAIKGDKKSILKLCETEGKQILYICIKIMGNQQDGEDAAQEVFVKMYKNIHKLREPAAYPVWINRLIMNTCLDMKSLAENKKEKVPIEKYSDVLDETKKEFLPSEYAEKQDQRDRLLHVINELPPKDEMVILMYYYESLTQKEIAEVLDVTENAIQHRLRRAHITIRKKLGVYDDYQEEKVSTIKVPVITQVMKGEASQISSPAVVEKLAISSSALGKAALAKGSQTAIALAAKIAGGIISASAITIGFAIVITQNGNASSINTPVPNSFSSQVTSSPKRADSVVEEETSGISFSEVVNASEENEISYKKDENSEEKDAEPVNELKTIMVKGKVVFENEENQVLEYEGSMLQGISVKIFDVKGKVIATAKTDTSGNYTFENVELNPQTEYTVRATLSTKNGNEFKNDLEKEKIFVITDENVITLENIAITNTIKPAVSVKLYGQDGKRGSVNPERCEIIPYDNFKGENFTIAWKITDESTGVIVAEGKGAEITKEDLFFKSQVAINQYKLEIVIENEFGNTARREIEFMTTQ